MSRLHKQVVDGIKDAMRNKDRVRLATLRDAKSKFVLEQTKTGSTDELDDAEVIKILSKLQRQRLDTAEVYTSQGRQDLADDELAQADVLADFLPQALSEEEVKAKVEEIISRLGATGMGDMGKVMGVASGEMAGRAEGKVISQFVREILNS
ncbi:MAG: glutamyl-tRNA amidotransferase [Euryarchaeota archaeon]|nr:glutamyl-tRNA amidotransferase [Euryarchaeota archaeon]|tara:strand:- start:89 stop:544 length:456 start_codon:yes stop_codon:yes gene_type:complete